MMRACLYGAMAISQLLCLADEAVSFIPGLHPASVEQCGR